MHEISAWHDWHAGESIVVCGLGPSVKEFAPYAEYFTTIGVNDIDRHFAPDYLIVVDSFSQFERDRPDRVNRREVIRNTGARAVFSQLQSDALGFEPKFRVSMDLIRMNPVNLDHPKAIACTNNTPFIGAALAGYMGAKKIGLIGVDLKGHAFESSAPQISQDFFALNETIKARNGGEIINLSQISLITSLRRGSLEDLLPPEVAERLRRKAKS